MKHFLAPELPSEEVCGAMCGVEGVIKGKMSPL